MTTDGGKGYRPRPFSVAQHEYETRWDAIFGRDDVREQALQRLEESKLVDKEFNQQQNTDN